MITKSKAIAKRMCKSKNHFLEKGQINGESPQESDEGKERLKILKIQKISCQRRRTIRRNSKSK